MSEGRTADPRGSNTEGDEGMLSDYIVSDGDVVSDSTDEEGRPKRLPRIMYDHRHVFGGAKEQCTFALKVLVGEHTCLFDIHNKLADYKWLAKQYIDVFRLRPCMQVQEMALDVNTRFSIQPSLGRLYRAKAHTLELLRGSVKKHYNSLRSYMSELMRVDKEGRFELLLGDDSVFRGLYIGFSALRKGFMEGCRRIIGLDGCFLKTYLGGQLLCAVSKDGNNKMFLVAWAVVEAENEECWSWFLKLLLEELGVTDGLRISFISDQQKGLQNAVASLAPFAEHKNCARHVYCNWKKTHKRATLKNLFWRAVRASYQQEFDLAMEEIKAESQATHTDFINREYHRFCRCFISTHCLSDMVDNNVSETFNGYIMKAGAKHIITMLEDIRVALRGRQYKKLGLVTDCIEKICPNIRKKLDKLRYDARMYRAHPGLGGKFEVSCYDDRFVVQLGERSCSRRQWDISGIPCKHAITTLHFMKKEPTEYVHECYSVEKYLKAYADGLEPINGETMWPKGVGYPVQPPLIRAMPGRPKKKRRRDVDERDPNNNTRLMGLG
ncbi:uncharacterized protein LOC131002930 [Salvia miltiorrhiza]|uniref:uncharacterized protein LOC131002930 n=1 Tax=Salvia miltiorrhiza TaxID=226208 RepID=UPI0025AC1438|nr:uncharacterized protein LOC131002930 [Salvia miltiorrhiza]